MRHVVTRFLWVDERIKLHHFTLECIYKETQSRRLDDVNADKTRQRTDL